MSLLRLLPGIPVADTANKPFGYVCQRSSAERGSAGHMERVGFSQWEHRAGARKVSHVPTLT